MIIQFITTNTIINFVQENINILILITISRLNNNNIIILLYYNIMIIISNNNRPYSNDSVTEKCL